MVCLTWPLIWVGSLVTTYDAGMAVPDWPGTYGYNMFLYPWTTWLFGPFDLLIEHGHRLLGALVGMVAIAAVVMAFRRENRSWVIWLACFALVAVCLQGGLGGMRVRLDARGLAMIHGCFAQIFFVTCVALAATTGKVWERLAQAVSDRSTGPSSGSLAQGLGAARWLAITAFLQLLLGAQLRHVQANFPATGFRHLVFTHAAMAGVVLLLVLLLAWRVRRCGVLTLWFPAVVLVTLVTLQISLGILTWVANYGWPWMLDSWPFAGRHLIQAKGMWESWITTGHVATGSLILAVAALEWLRLRRVLWVEQRAVGSANELVQPE